ncbi:protein ACTIVITY OF BC1 COMPLEX KINASE 7, chloroplastic isoform X1 [Oryza sativa Japonica Group]|uniref:protein ACTIVITY OF BC1 COMPLEX KINASE 7, chloroplastic isoform X1 n=1 Tax=Oryza sativa subsp. japonica TaxID=39947 RepID=UPI00077558EE|nr:protein ACTIVITY OF BC1 COMPLEX KINASE 7, chloroplastic isoform X1 [Oryza sativa Japonica Group]XP_015651255.1 protein ACTIVITY OF BC1 COMPLEX KINASE 7, chloroplastic isoform X1 [Oryza sativa Japonica Group]
MAMMMADLSFSSSISNVKLQRFRASSNETSLIKRSPVFRAEARSTETEKFRTNGRAIKMVPTTELKRSKSGVRVRPDTVNGSPSGAVNGSTKVAINGSPNAAVNGSMKAVTNGSVNGTSLVKGSNMSALVKTQKRMRPNDDPFEEELKVLPSDEGFSWAKDNYNSWQRSADIWSFVLSFRIRVLFDNAKWAYAGGFSEEKQKVRRRKTASWLREQVLQLGPTFIKLGQLSSTRSDLFPREFVDELAKLQDRVPAFSPEKAKAFIEKEMGCPIEVVYKEFDNRPIAAASLGQVHRAVLHNGERVAVKVQRPGLRKLFDIDLRNLKLVAEYFQSSEAFGGPSRDWIGIYEECSKILYEEIDYINEGKNADRFRRDFRNIKWVRVPLIMWDYTTEKVLTLEYVPGIKINNLTLLDNRGYSRSLIASRSIESYLIQILKTGFFHADPHPGNLAIDTDGSLIYYDFGMMGEIKSFTRERLLSLFYAVYEKDANKVMKALIDLEALQATGDLSPVRRSIQFFLDNLLSQTPDQQQTLAAIGEVVWPYNFLRISFINWDILVNILFFFPLQDLFAISQDQPFRFPSTFTFVIRAFSTLEGIGYILDPDFSFVKVAAPYAQELLDLKQRRTSAPELVREIRKQANSARDSTISMPYRIQRIEDFVGQLESGDLKLRVRVLESERAARKANVLQMATMYTAIGGTLLNVGVTLSSQGNQIVANGSFVGAGIFLALLIRSMQRVKKLDKFETMI